MVRPNFHRQMLRVLTGGATCRETVEEVTDYLEGRLGPRQRLSFQVHQVICTGCRIYLHQMKQTLQTLRAMRSEPVSRQVRQELMQQFVAWRAGKAMAPG